MLMHDLSPVKDVYTSMDKLVTYNLSKSLRIEVLLHEFIKSPKANKPIGVVPVLRNEDNISQGNYELVSYIDVLKRWDKLLIVL